MFIVFQYLWSCMCCPDECCPWLLTSSNDFSVNKDDVPDNEQEKGTEKDMAVNEDAEMVSPSD